MNAHTGLPDSLGQVCVVDLAVELGKGDQQVQSCRDALDVDLWQVLPQRDEEGVAAGAVAGAHEADVAVELAGPDVLAVCRDHGAAYSFHHNRLVKPFLEEPAMAAPPENPDDVTASGPPLDVVVAELKRLSDLRAARARPGTVGARASLDKLRGIIEAH